MQRKQCPASIGSQEDQDRIGATLVSLLQTLDKLKAASRDQNGPNDDGSPADPLGHAQLIGRIRARLNDCEQLILGAAVRSSAGQSSRANLMRYSTPNLLLSSNFEHILRQRGDKVS